LAFGQTQGDWLEVKKERKSDGSAKVEFEHKARIFLPILTTGANVSATFR